MKEHLWSFETASFFILIGLKPDMRKKPKADSEWARRVKTAEFMRMERKQNPNEHASEVVGELSNPEYLSMMDFIYITYNNSNMTSTEDYTYQNTRTYDMLKKI